MSLIKDIIIGIIIGGGMILPGVSGGVLAVILGVYEKIIYALTNFLKDWKKNISFLTPILLGFAIGIIIFGNILNYVFDKYYMESCFTFIGLIMGGTIVLLKEAQNKDTGKINNLAFWLSLIITIILFVLGKDKLDINFSADLNNNIISYILLFTTGVLFIAGKIIPGISSSFLLMLIGMYEYLLDVIADPLSLTRDQYYQLIIIVLGVIVGGIILIKLMKYLLENHRSITYSSITGFVIGSIYAIYPGFSFNMHGLISIILLVLSYIASYQFSVSSNKLHK